ncbi:hypothetical protein HQK13_02455 [Blautia wexlerae]|uniref:hypothetical protein n=1 Tax=Blautia wexlerae TaxID=418240 RepID=UPI001570366B|nr:hypothetical protein [Blautia wexlerae]NSF23834.1 hypothetical protein [Blautia wexlerae]
MSKIMSKIVMVFVVMNLIGIAVALFLESGLGSDSVGLLCDGIRHTFLISFGNASLFYNLLIILIACLQITLKRNASSATAERLFHF